MLGFPGDAMPSLMAQVVKASAYNAGDPDLIPGLGRSSGEGNGNPLQYSCLENLMDGGAFVGYNPWGRKELDTTERLNSLSLSQVVLVVKNPPAYSE